MRFTMRSRLSVSLDAFVFAIIDTASLLGWVLLLDGLPLVGTDSKFPLGLIKSIAHRLVPSVRNPVVFREPEQIARAFAGVLCDLDSKERRELMPALKVRPRVLGSAGIVVHSPKSNPHRGHKV